MTHHAKNVFNHSEQDGEGVAEGKGGIGVGKGKNTENPFGDSIQGGGLHTHSLTVKAEGL